ncbi:hypothetical protein BHM03_00003584 [Ensete ventricosum]|nr:hypothetical protein BHM03_00003584 [Ensete ventricosum]
MAWSLPSAQARLGVSGLSQFSISGVCTSGWLLLSPVGSVSAEKNLHKGLIGMGVSDVTPPTFKSKVKTYDRHKSRHTEGGSKPHSSKGKEQVGAVRETHTPRPQRPRFVKELYHTSAGEGDKVKTYDRHKSQHVEGGSKPHSSKGKEQVGAVKETQTPRPRRPRFVKELYQTSAGEGDVGFYALCMYDLLVGDPEAPLEARWSSLKQGTKTQHYCMALADHVHDAGRVINLMDNKAEGLKKEIANLRAWSGSKVVAAADPKVVEAQALVDDLKVKLEEANRRRASLEIEVDNYRANLADLQEQLKEV